VERSGKRRALGRGLDALIPTGSPEVATSSGVTDTALLRIPVDRVRPNPFQPRQQFDDTELEELASSIRANGLLQPIVVRAKGAEYELVAGERRLRAAQRAGLQEIPAIVRQVGDHEALELALIENLQRSDLNPIEEARAYERLRDEFGLTQEQIAARVGKHRSTIANALRLLRLPQDLQDELAAGRLTAGHARALLSVDSPEEQRRLAREFLRTGASVRDAERRAQPARKQLQLPDANWRAVEDELRRLLDTKVRLLPRRDGTGKLEIEYFSLDQLNALLTRLGLRFA
jgi:ParB family chromosome partitioning protein